MSSSTDVELLAGNSFSKVAWGCLRALLLLQWLLWGNPGLKGAPEVAESGEGRSE
jgi:hypothetical protein